MAKKIVEKVKAAGVVGAGGAGFPTHVKMDSQVEWVIANGAECEPLLQVDEQLMTSHVEEVLAGLDLVMQATGASKGVVALKREYEGAVAALEEVMGRYPRVSLHLLGSYYPSGDEFLLVYEVTDRLVPEGGIPLEVDVVVQNVNTLINIAAAQQGIPVTHRHLTVIGEVNNPKTVRVPVGTSVAAVIDLAGGLKQPPPRANYRPVLSPDSANYALVSGGPMMGHLVDFDSPVVKTMGGLLVLPWENETVRRLAESMDTAVRRGRSTCDQCRDCTDLCPRYLLGHELMPHDVMRAIGYGLSELSRTVTAAVLCCECRLCEAYACPLHLSPMAFYRKIKQDLTAQGWKNTRHRRRDLQPHPFRDERKVPVRRLMDRLGLNHYRGIKAPLDERDFEPPSVRIPLRQHLGTPAKPTVKVGDAVQQGDLIAAIPRRKLGANVHASISGKVEEVVAGEYIAIAA
ncbi:MAG: 4Fe-4S dicluster domain-containing protein [Anaerolineae bacterium]